MPLRWRCIPGTVELWLAHESAVPVRLMYLPKVKGKAPTTTTVWLCCPGFRLYFLRRCLWCRPQLLTNSHQYLWRILGQQLRQCSVCSNQSFSTPSLMLRKKVEDTFHDLVLSVAILICAQRNWWFPLLFHKCFECPELPPPTLKLGHTEASIRLVSTPSLPDVIKLHDHRMLTHREVRMVKKVLRKTGELLVSEYLEHILSLLLLLLLLFHTFYCTCIFSWL